MATICQEGDELMGILLFPAPDLTFPMDSIDVTTLTGSIPGVLVGNPQLVEGPHGRALQTDGPAHYVRFTLRTDDSCLRNPDFCLSGITFSMWLMNLRGNDDVMNKVFGSNGCLISGIGFCFGLSSGEFWIAVRGGVMIHRHWITVMTENIWYLVAITFSPADGLKLYINGCDSSEYRIQEGYQAIESHTPHMDDESTSFTLGEASHVLLDQLLIWYDVLGPDEIWSLHTQLTDVWSFICNFSRTVFH